MEKIVLFDMDGTLTPPRQQLDHSLLGPLKVLSHFCDIGVVTGSDIDYVNQQMEKLIKYSELRYITHILPCNGTKYYRPPSQCDDRYTLVHNNDMARELPSDCLREVFKVLTSSQADVCYHSIPLTGHFINYRGSMINWCPIGRNANDEQRKFFVHYDTAYERTYRDQLKEKLERTLRHKNILKHLTVKFGGSTSFDIYPNGWDKRHCLTHFNDWETWFVGDKCEDGGNDQELYEHLFDEGRSFKTEDTNQTRLIIDEQIIPILLQNSE